MARAQLVTVSLLIGAALGSAVVLFIPSPREKTLEDRIADLESDLAEAQREVNDAESVALRERERKEDAEEEALNLRRALATAPAPGAAQESGEGAADAGTGHAGLGGRPGSPAIEPAEWDDPRLRMEIQRLAMNGRRMGSSPRLGWCVEAARAQGDSALALLIDIMRRPGLPENVRRAAVLILERLGDERAVRTLLAAWDGATEFDEQRMLLRALANLPGAEQVARRGHGTARRVVRGEADGVQSAIRARAIESLHVFVRTGEYAETDFIADFGKALVTADGEGQQRLSLLALEGFWQPACVAPLREYAARDDVREELRKRATDWADAIESGETRPAGAGQPKARRIRAPDGGPDAPPADDGGDDTSDE